MDSFSIKLPRRQPESVYTSVLTKDGKLTLPEGCFTDKTGSENSTDSLVVTYSLEDGIICLYNLDDFDEICANLALLNSMDQNARRLKRRIIGYAENVSMDKKRQIKLQAEFMKTLGFETNPDDVKDETGFPIMLLKYPNRIEITSLAVYKTIIEELENQQQEE